MHIHVKKASGQIVPFDRDKLIRSLKRSGAYDQLAHQITDEIESEISHGLATKKIYQKAFQLLKRLNKPAATTYQLKKGVMELGPTGFPFEYLVASIFKEKGYQVEVGKIMQGKCVNHEVDVFATNENEVRFIECKFHNQSGVKSDVKIALYVTSRVNDLATKWKSNHPLDKRNISGGLVTNTKLTEDARTFSRCSGLIAMGWDSPSNRGLLDYLKLYSLLPITLLHKITKKEKARILDEGVILCRDLITNKGILEKLGFDLRRSEKIINEAKEMMGFYK